MGTGVMQGATFVEAAGGTRARPARTDTFLIAAVDGIPFGAMQTSLKFLVCVEAADWLGRTGDGKMVEAASSPTAGAGRVLPTSLQTEDIGTAPAGLQFAARRGDKLAAGFVVRPTSDRIARL